MLISLRALIGVFAFLALLAVTCGTAGADEPDVVLVDLADAGQVASWTTLNDPVMGGTSTSTVAYGGGGLVFSGTISLENNGGFASARSPQNPDIGVRATGA